GIRDFHVTGVQTCALPILWSMDYQWIIPLFSPQNYLHSTTQNDIPYETFSRLLLSPYFFFSHCTIPTFGSGGPKSCFHRTEGHRVAQGFSPTPGIGK